MNQSVATMMTRVRDAHPLVHHITNYVTVNDCANVCICAGGAPVMTDAVQDIPEMVAHASAVVLNIGTLNSRTSDAMIVAGKSANLAGIPVVLDPVGVGATSYRTETAERIMRSVKIAVIKGNAGEIGILAGAGGEVRGVDAVSGAHDTASATQQLAQRTNAIVAATGQIDYVSDGTTALALRNGTPLLEQVSGTGCMVSSIVGCYVGTCGVSLESVAAAISVFNIAAEIAASKADGPGTFKPRLLDAVATLRPADIDARLKVA